MSTLPPTADKDASRNGKPKKEIWPGTLFAAVAAVSILCILVLLATKDALPKAQLALFAACLSTLGLALVRLADGFAKPTGAQTRRAEDRYARFWLTCFALAFAGLIAVDTLGRIPKEIETPWLHATRHPQPADPRCVALTDVRAPDAQYIAALRAGCR